MEHGTGSVVVNHGVHALVDTDRDGLVRCTVKGKRLRAVCGDIVEWERVDGHGGVITGLVSRGRALERADGRGGSAAVASHLDRVLIVVAPEPSPDLVLIDRYLVMTELAGLAGALLLNKTDLAPSGFESCFEEYIQAGYPLWRTSATTGIGMEALRSALAGTVTILVGQSGVGKSSLLNALIPDLDLQTGVLSAATGEGRHTTTTTMRYRLPGGGALVDSPGVREFWLPPMDAAMFMPGFREIAVLAAQCRFRDCVHVNEPDCAVREAVERGEVSRRRFDSYRQLLRAVTGGKAGG